MTLRKSRVFVALAALLVLSLALVGCGGGGDKDSGSGDVTTLTIGVGAPLTQGAAATGQGIKRGVELAVANMNASPEAEAAGIQFRTAEGDDQGDPKTGVTAANTFASDRSVIGVVGHYNSGVSIPASKVYNENNIVMVSPGSTNPNLTQQGFKNVFRTCATDDLQGPTAARDMLALGYKKVIGVDDSTPYGEGLLAEFLKEFKAGGGEVLFEAKTTDKDTDFNALVTKAKAAGPDLIYYGGMYNAGALFSKQMKDGGLKAPMCGGDGMFSPEFINLAGAAAEGDYTTSVGLPVELLPAGEQFLKDYEAKFPGIEVAGFDAYGYDAAMAIMKGVLAAADEVGADKVTSPAGREAVIAAVAAVNFEGVTGEVGFDENGDTINKVVTLYQVADGKWVAQTR